MTDRDALKAVATRLADIEIRHVFVGGMIRGLLITDPGAAPARPTKDIDVVVEVSTMTEMHELNEELRRRGFAECQEEDAPICRWEADRILVDVMPVDPQVLGFSNVWYPGALETRAFFEVVDGTKIPIVNGPHFVATKLEAFLSRGEGDLYHHDLEDVLSLVNDREELVSELAGAPKRLREFVSKKVADLLQDPPFVESLPGHLEADAASQARLPLLRQRLDSIARLATRASVQTSARTPRRPRPGSTGAGIGFHHSTNIESASYNETVRTLTIKFRSGRIYEYYQVPSTIYSGLLRAASAGQYHHQWIKDRYAYERVSESSSRRK